MIENINNILERIKNLKSVEAASLRISGSEEDPPPRWPTP